MGHPQTPGKRTLSISFSLYLEVPFWPPPLDISCPCPLGVQHDEGGHHSDPPAQPRAVGPALTPVACTGWESHSSVLPHRKYWSHLLAVLSLSVSQHCPLLITWTSNLRLPSTPSTSQGWMFPVCALRRAALAHFLPKSQFLAELELRAGTWQVFAGSMMLFANGAVIEPFHAAANFGSSSPSFSLSCSTFTPHC